MTNHFIEMALDEDAIVGCLLGQAIGDAMGLPMENLTPNRIQKLFPQLDRPQFFLGRGMGSDDTEHACITGQAILQSGGDLERFRKSLGWGLRWWFLAGPPGIGLATLKACLKLWLGFSSKKSGVRSAGNGPAMRAAIIGACGSSNEISKIVHDSTVITHTDQQAIFGATIISQLAHLAANSRQFPSRNWETILSELYEGIQEELPESDICRNMFEIPGSLQKGLAVSEFVAVMGLKRGVTGYIAHTVPVAVYAFCRHSDDYRAAVESVIRCGGDTDTIAAITGALVGARVGKSGIPKEWLEGFADWPRSVKWIERLGIELAKGDWQTRPQPKISLAWYWIPFRNLFFFVIVLLHIARRMLPPY